MLSIPDAVVNWLAENDYGEVVSMTPISAGDESRGMRVTTRSMQSFWLKTNPVAPPDLFMREAEGLDWLKIPGGPTIPRLYLVGKDYLLLEDLPEQPRRGDFWSSLGQQIAALHHCTNDEFGFGHDNYIEGVRQRNDWEKDGYLFYAGQRLLLQARRAYEAQILDWGLYRRIEQLASRLLRLIPDDLPVLCHGNLRSRTAVVGSEGEPVLIEPAVYYGWAEADLALTVLFGSFPEAFYRSYEEFRPLEPEYRERFPLYNLYHLLIRVNLIGSGFLGHVIAILDRFS